MPQTDSSDLLDWTRLSGLARLWYLRAKGQQQPIARSHFFLCPFLLTLTSCFFRPQVSPTRLCLFMMCLYNT